jgi:hypothetical protein
MTEERQPPRGHAPRTAAKKGNTGAPHLGARKVEGRDE